MSNRINITYSVRLSDLPAETKRLYRLILDDLGKLHSSSTLPKDFLSAATLGQVKELGDDLSDILTRLGDLEALISAHIGFVLSPPSDPSTSTNPSDAIDKLKERLSDLEGLEALSDEVAT